MLLHLQLSSSSSTTQIIFLLQKERLNKRQRPFLFFSQMTIIVFKQTIPSERSCSTCNFLTLDVVARVSPFYGCKYWLDKSSHPWPSLEIWCENQSMLRFQKGIRIQMQISTTRPGSSRGWEEVSISFLYFKSKLKVFITWWCNWNSVRVIVSSDCSSFLQTTHVFFLSSSIVI